MISSEGENWDEILTVEDYYESLSLSAMRFSFIRDGNDIIVVEDSYASLNEPNSLVMVVLHTFMLILLIYAGNRKKKNSAY